MNYTDPDPSSGLALASFIAVLDGQDVSASYTVQPGAASGSLPAPLSEGNHSISYSLADQAGNVAQLEVGFFVDSMPPNVIVVPVEGQIFDPQSEFVVTFTDPVPSAGINTATFSAIFDGQDVTSSFVVTASEARFTPSEPLSIGSHTLVVSVQDGAGNQSQLTRIVAFLDQAAPIVTLSPPDSAVTSDPRPTLTVSYSDPAPSSEINTGSFYATLDGSTVTGDFAVSQAAASLTPTSDLTEGLHNWVAGVSDQSGNHGESAAAFVVDTVAPFLTSSIAPDEIVPTDTPNLVATYADPPPGSGLDLATFMAILDGQDMAASFDLGSIQASYPVSSSAPLSGGPHTLTYRISDQASNQSAQTLSFVVDTGPPQVSIISPPDGAQLTDGEALFVVQFSDTGAGLDLNTLSITLNGVDRTGDFTITAQGAQLHLDAGTALPIGAYTLTADISDNAGHSNQATSSFTYPGPDDGSSPALSLVGLDNQIFSPAPNPYVEPAELKTKILIRYDQPATTLVTVQDAAGTPVRSLVLPLANTNETVTIAWDGRDEQGRLVIDAGYGLVIQGSNLFGRSSNSETVEVRLFY